MTSSFCELNKKSKLQKQYLEAADDDSHSFITLRKKSKDVTMPLLKLRPITRE